LTVRESSVEGSNDFGGLAHVGLSVSDLDAAVAFWECFLGAPPSSRLTLDRPYVGRLVGISDVRIEAAFFDLHGDVRLELLEYPPAPASEPNAHERPGHAHFCLWTQGAAQSWRRAVDCGAEPVDPAGPVAIDSGRHAGLWAAYLRIPPDGHVLELFAREP
jgi:catechol 2,3-dioxygenase-like lactoylglutathione lyase family enzyme